MTGQGFFLLESRMGKNFFSMKKDECNTYRMNKKQILFLILPPIFLIYYRISHIFMLYSEQRSKIMMVAEIFQRTQQVQDCRTFAVVCAIFLFIRYQQKSFFLCPVAGGVLVINRGSMAWIQVDIHPSQYEGRSWRPFWHVYSEKKKAGKRKKILQPPESLNDFL